MAIRNPPAILPQSFPGGKLLPGISWPLPCSSLFFFFFFWLKFADWNFFFSFADEIVLAVTPCRLLIWTLISWWHTVPSCLPQGRCEARKGGCTPSRKTFCETNNWKISVQQKQAYHSEKPKAQICSKKQACVCFLEIVVVLIIWKAWLAKQN